jgi:hypothetical protein
MGTTLASRHPALPYFWSIHAKRRPRFPRWLTKWREFCLSPCFWQDRLAAGTTADLWYPERRHLAIFPSIWTHSSCQVLLNA